MMKNIDCFILCGGKGSRLKKMTGKVPKPMVSIAGRPFLDIAISHLSSLGFKRIILGTGYKAKFIRNYYEQHKISGTKIIFSEESKPMGTAGALKKAERLIKSKIFLVLNGDSFPEFNIKGFFNFYRQKKASFLILLKRVNDCRDFGSVKLDSKYRISSFSEKCSRKSNSFVNAGVYLFNRDIFFRIPKDRPFSLEYDLFPKILGDGLYGYRDRGTFIDIGTPKRYLSAKKYFLKAHQRLPNIRKDL